MHTGKCSRSYATLPALTVLLVFLCCSPRISLLVDYLVPDTSNHLEGQQVCLEVKDVRADTHLFTATAIQDFDGFKDRYDLTLVTPNKARISVGEKNLQGLFSEAIKKRLESLGAVVTTTGRKDLPLFQVLIRDFKIDLQDRKWLSSASYEANLSIDNQLVARELVTGSAERIKILGSKGADTTLSDIFTEMINRLNIVKLFQQAKMV